MKLDMIVDLECTCWPEGYESDKFIRKETIEIGATFLKDGFIVGVFSAFVKPILLFTKGGTLHEFCTSLTGITDSDLIDRPLFGESFNNLKNYAKIAVGKDFCEIKWGSWGHFDYRQLERDLRYCGRGNESLGDHISIKHEFAKRRKIRPCGMKAALNILDIKLSGNHHRALDDAMNISRIYAEEWLN